MMKKKTRNRPGRCLHPDAVNLYRFIRLVVGPDVTKKQIAKRWDMDAKNFHGVCFGYYPPPKIKRLVSLAKALGVNRHLVFEVACGVPADKVFNLIKKNDLKGQIKLIFGK
jgi:hypothetical protein